MSNLPKIGLFSDEGELQLDRPGRNLNAAEAEVEWRKAYAYRRLTHEEMRNCRIVIAWRITREIALRQNRLALNEPLAAISPGEWDIRVDGLSLSPDRSSRPYLESFGRLVSALDAEMGLSEGTKMQPFLGYYGMHGMCDAETLKGSWPTREEILACEEELLRWLRSRLAKECSPKHQTVDLLTDLLGLTTEQADGVVRMAAETLRRMSDIPPEDSKAILIGQATKLLEDAVEAGDLGCTRHTLRLLAAIGGHLGAAGQHQDDLLEIMQEVAGEEEDTPKALEDSGGRVQVEITDPIEAEETNE